MNNHSDNLSNSKGEDDSDKDLEKLFQQKNEILKKDNIKITDLENKIVDLSKIEANLEEENKVLDNISETIRVDQSGLTKVAENNIDLQKEVILLTIKNKSLLQNISELESKIAKYKEKNSDLEKINIELEEKYKLLCEKREKIKANQEIIDNLKENIVMLQQKVAKLEKENQQHTEKNEILKAALLLNVESETKNLIRPKFTLEEERIITIPKEKTEEGITKIDAATNVRNNREEIPAMTEEIVNNKTIKSIEPIEAIEPMSMPKISPLSSTTVNEISSPSSTKFKTMKEQKEFIKESRIKRRICPKCKNSTPYLLYEIIDKTNVIMDYPRIYGKKYKCGACGNEFR